MTDQSPTTPGGSTVPPSGRFRLDPETSTIRVDVRVMFGLMNVKGTLRLLDGEIDIGADPTTSSVRARIDAASYESGNKKRDSDVTSSGLLDVDTYPEISFTATGAQPDGRRWLVPGVVTAHGTNRDVQVVLDEARFEEDGARFRGTAHLDRTAFGVTGKRGMVGRDAIVQFEARALKV